MARVALSPLGSDVSITEIEGATLVTEAEGIAGNDNDTTIPTSAAVKAYADAVAPTNITVAAEAADTTCYPMLATDATGSIAPKTSSHLTYDAANNILHAHKIAGDATDGLLVESANGTDVALMGAANTANSTFYGAVNIDGTTRLATSLTGVLRADSGTVSADTDVTDIVSAASDSAAGKVELAIASEVTTGTDATRAVTPDALAGSDYGKRVVGIQVFDSATATATGDGKAFFRIPSTLNGYNLVGVAANVYTAGTTNTTDIQIRNVTQAADMLTTKITIDSTETDSSTATAAAIDAANDDVATGDKIAIDVDAVHTTPANGLYVELIFQLP